MTETSEPIDPSSDEMPASWVPETPGDREAVREQVGRVLSSTLFRNSKRFPIFLHHTVEHALTSTDPLKERTIGHEVFGRDPSYDTSQDPVVRMTAAEVRKRLAQYYQQPEHQGELVIAYQPGSYIPEFFPQAQRPSAVGPVESVEPLSVKPRSTALPPWMMAAGVAAVLLLMILGVLIASRRSTATDADAIGRFWRPILDSPSPVLICIGDPATGQDQQTGLAAQPQEDLSIGEFVRSNLVRYTDALTLVTITGELKARGKPFRIRRPAATDLQDLRDGPVILIGGFNNPWTLRLSAGLRFTLASGVSGGPYVRDRERPEFSDWHLQTSGGLIRNLTRTYGLITRVRNPVTGDTVLSVSGLAMGTATAGECLINSECLTTVERMTSNHETPNIQIVVAVPVIRQNAGAPQVVAVHSW